MNKINDNIRIIWTENVMLYMIKEKGSMPIFLGNDVPNVIKYENIFILYASL